jgi:hypothetical protein
MPQEDDRCLILCLDGSWVEEMGDIKGVAGARERYRRTTQARLAYVESQQKREAGE